MYAFTPVKKPGFDISNAYRGTPNYTAASTYGQKNVFCKKSGKTNWLD
jgi:hypothetical protein